MPRDRSTPAALPESQAPRAQRGIQSVEVGGQRLERLPGQRVHQVDVEGLEDRLRLGQRRARIVGLAQVDLETTRSSV